jgi:hypothetical protein
LISWSFPLSSLWIPVVNTTRFLYSSSSRPFIFTQNCSVQFGDYVQWFSVIHLFSAQGEFFFHIHLLFVMYCRWLRCRAHARDGGVVKRMSCFSGRRRRCFTVGGFLDRLLTELGMDSYSHGSKSASIWTIS